MRANTDHLPPSLTRAVKVVKETDRQIHRQADNRRETQLPPSTPRSLAEQRVVPACMLCCVVSESRSRDTSWVLPPQPAAFSAIHTLSRFDIAVIHARTHSCHIPLNSIASSCGLSLSRYREIRGTEGERRNCLSSWWLTFFGPPAACNSLAGSTARTLMPTALSRPGGRGREGGVGSPGP